jgi:hypothetical protein
VRGTGRRGAERLRRPGVTVRIGSGAGLSPLDVERAKTWGAMLRDVNAATKRRATSIISCSVQVVGFSSA